MSMHIRRLIVAAVGATAACIVLTQVALAGTVAAGAAPQAVPLGTLQACEAFNGLPPASSDSDQVRVPAGSFVMGSDGGYPEEAPARSVKVGSFMIDRYDVTNGEFARFVAATGYKTLAERGLDAKRYPSLPAEMTRPGSTVFLPPKDLLVGAMQWAAFRAGRRLASSTPGPAVRSTGSAIIRSCISHMKTRWLTLEVARPLRFADRKPKLRIRGARRHLDYLSVGRHLRDSVEDDGQHLAGRLSVSEHRERTASCRLHRSAAFRPTAMGYTTWSVMSGSG